MAGVLRSVTPAARQSLISNRACTSTAYDFSVSKGLISVSLDEDNFVGELLGPGMGNNCYNLGKQPCNICFTDASGMVWLWRARGLVRSTPVYISCM